MKKFLIFILLIFLYGCEYNNMPPYIMFLQSQTLPDSGLTETFLASSLTVRNITWTFDTEYLVGQFANGDYFIVENIPGTGINITAFSPECTTDGSGYVINGSMINPDPTVNYQGFNENITDFAYSSSLNVAYGVNAENPLNVSANSSLISTIYRVPDSNHSYIQSAEVLTVLSEIPSNGAFRPTMAGNDKTITHYKSELNYNLLLNLTAVTGTYNMADAADLFARPWLEFNGNPISSSIHPADNMEWYGRDIASDIGVGALMLNLDYTNSEKEDLMIYYTQLGLELYGTIQNGGDWEANGGHSGGRKWPILFAAKVLNDSSMLTFFAKTGDYLYENGYYEGNQPPDIIHFGEDDQIFTVVQRDVDRGVGYTSGDLGLAEWGISHNLTPAMDDPDWGASYRTAAGTCLPGIALAVLMMDSVTEVTTTWKHEVFFDYIERFMGIGTANDTFTQNMFDTYWSTYYI